MKTKTARVSTMLLATLCELLTTSALSTVRYVDVNSASPTPPFNNWAVAATNIQDAIDVAVAGDEIVVTNGLYETGGRAVSGTMTNRVVVDKALTVRSVNGPEVTVIRGYQVPGTTNGDGAVRCVYLGNGAALVGFTLMNGATRNSGDFNLEEHGGGIWCAAAGAVVSNCVVNGNTAHAYGGGAYAYDGGGLGGTLNNCTLTGNSASQGGGVGGGTLNNCTLTGNSAYYGGGASTANLNNCALNGNLAEGEYAGGGGADECNLNNCTLTGNSANGEYGSGGGATYSTLNNCSLSGNSAQYGGGADDCALNNCTVTGNSAGYGGGVHGSGGEGGYSTLNNCIVYFNRARYSAPNYSSAVSLNYCCTTPLPPFSVGNLTAEPQLANSSHLSASSPCRGAGSVAYTNGVDIDGEAWVNPPAIGCDEFHLGAAPGPVSVAIQSSFTNAPTGFEVNFTAQINGKLTASRWEFGDGTVVSNRPYAGHAWAQAGDYLVVLRAYNQSYPDGVSATVAVQVVSQPVHYVAAENSTPVPPYLSWATAANTIQDAVDAASAGALVLVTNGVYQTGGRTVDGTTTNRVAVDKPLTVRSVNGPEVTVIRGYQVPGTTNGEGAVRCAYLTNGAALVGFTLTNGAAEHGGGVWCDSMSSFVSYCVLSGNSAEYAGGSYFGTLNSCTLRGNSAFGWGGGAAYGMLNNCTLSGNSAQDIGGGAYNSTLNNCALTGNSAGYGGGAYGGTLNNCTITGNSGGGVYYNCRGCGITMTVNNCIVYYNTAPSSGSNYSGRVSLNYCCTVPLPPDGIGNLTAEPQLASASHLSFSSPCRGAGSAAYVGGVDIDGEAWANPPSIGCDEVYPGADTGPLTVAIQASFTNVPTGFAVNFMAQIIGYASDNRWEFGDGTVLSNQLATTHTWSAPGDYLVVVRSYNQSHPDGISATVIVQVIEQPVHYVAVSDGNPVAPYSSWATAAKNIQDAVDAATVPGALLLVSNGVYSAGGQILDGFITNRVAITKLLTVRSVGGPAVTVIRGYQVPGTTNGNGAVRCVYLTNGAALVGFTLTNGAADNGGGVLCESAGAVVSNCVLSGNAARYGGGAYRGTLNNCTLSGNKSTLYGGGGYEVTLNNCTLSRNSAEQGGAAFNSTMNACTLTNNSAYHQGGGASYGILKDCTLRGNSANGPSSDGGGAYGGVLNNCTLTGNSAIRDGGGAASSSLTNCTLTGNSAQYGGGAAVSILNNCTLSGNSADAIHSGAGGGAHGGTLTSCILSSNSAYYGGGASAAQFHELTLNNCVLTGNTAHSGGGAIWGNLNDCSLSGNSARYGGGAENSTLNNCSLTGNSAQDSGGAAVACTLNNCTIAANSAAQGGGIDWGTLNNCIVYFNTAQFSGANYVGVVSFNYCCITPLPANGLGNFTNAPLFLNHAAGNLRLQSNSPCINAGLNAYAPSGHDLDGNARIAGGTVDLGAYEFQSPQSAISYAWLLGYGLPNDGSADFTDADGDGLNNWQEWHCLTDPTDEFSVLRLFAPSSAAPGVMVRWQSVSGRTYLLERSTGLGAQAAFGIIASNIVGQADTTVYTDTNAVGTGPFFYRVGAPP